MKQQDLEQFLIDHHPEGSIAEVDAPWLQQQLKNLEHYRRLITRLNERIDSLEAAREVFHSRIRLLV